MRPFPRYVGPVPFVTTAQMVEVDRAMIEDAGISLVQMMENAGRALAEVARRRFLGGDALGARVVVLAGSGGNGGGALVCARRLANLGARVSVVLSRPADQMAPVPAHQLDIVRRIGVPVTMSEPPAAEAAVALVIDGLIGYSLRGDPRGAAATLIRWANASPAPVLALDTPSGVDTTTGRLGDPAIRAAATLTLALPKTGLRAPAGRPHVGELYLADISVPPALYAGPGLELEVGPLFAHGDIVRLW